MTGTSHRWRAAATAAFLLACLAAPGGAQSAERRWRTGPPAPWIVEMPLNPASAASVRDAESGRVYELVDHQVRFGGGSVQIDYSRIAWTALSTAAVQNASEIQIRFDPSFSRLVIHRVRLLRAGRDVFAFRPSDVRVIQQETDLDAQIYSGELTAVIFLRDLRVGDTLDYAYSIEGSNPILQGGFDDRLLLAYESPVKIIRHVVQTPVGTTLRVAPRNTAVAPRVETAGAWRVHTWEARDVGALESDEHEPAWFDADPQVAVSTFASWAEVAEWARGLFDRQLGASTEPARLVRQLGLTRSGAAGAAEAVRFVQDEIRYLGIEMGPNSHQPQPPAQVLRQRFGDCKDKSLLLVALLRELGVDAVPALVDTNLRRGLDMAEPSPFAFDHAIVLAVIGGRQVWIDPSESDVGGRLEDRDPPEFERALVLRPGTVGLTVIPQPDRREPVEEVLETYTLGPPGAPVRLDVVSTYRRGEADAMRRELSAASPKDLAKTYLEDFAKDDPDIRALTAPAVTDDRARNVLVVTESYEAPTFWKNGRRTLSGWLVEDHLPAAVPSGRATPLAVPHPVHVRHTVVVRARDSFRLGPRGEAISDDAFAFTSALTARASEMRLSFDYQSLGDSVPPDRFAVYQKAVERVRGQLSFVLTPGLTSPDAPAEAWNPRWALGIGAGIAVAGVLLLVAVKFWHLT